MKNGAASDDAAEGYDYDDYVTFSPTEAPTESAWDYEFAAGWVGSISYSAIAIIVLVSACLIAYSQSRKTYHDYVAQHEEQTTLLERRPASSRVIV